MSLDKTRAVHREESLASETNVSKSKFYIFLSSFDPNPELNYELFSPSDYHIIISEQYDQEFALHLSSSNEDYGKQQRYQTVDMLTSPHVSYRCQKSHKFPFPDVKTDMKKDFHKHEREREGKVGLPFR